ncbi:MAG: hypothetical protein HUK21_13065, partial [Fibrobacteraceae bacterium]|nr:hypothetical protein [Fibrobacteraceae bacterium]
QIYAPAQPMELMIRDLRGVLLMHRQINGPTAIPLGNFPRTRLIVQLKNSMGKNMLLKVVK